MSAKTQMRKMRPYFAQAKNTARNMALHLKPRGGLPDLVIIGAQKAGTTSLFTSLSAHPNILPARMKEVHFADRNWHRGQSWYERCFPTGEGLRLEATPNYLFFPHAAERLSQTAPKARLIAILRDPVARAISHHRYETQRGSETRSFQQAIEEELAQGDADWNKAVASPDHWPFALQHHSYLRRGQYSEHLARWRTYFDLDQMMIIEDQALYQAPKEQLGRLLEFANLPQDHTLSLNRENSGRTDVAPLDPALYAYFANDCATLIRDWGLRPSWASACGIAE